MKKALLCSVFVLACSLVAFAAEKSTLTGWFSDSGCGASADKSMNAGHKGCALNCVKNGAKWVFVDSSSKKALKIHNQDAVTAAHVGKEVKVEASMMGSDGIHIESISGM
ncbi:MAG: hypothetical protein V3R60_01160 [Acidobacteriota bacterium]